MKLVVFVTCITDQVNLLCSESATNKSIRERERKRLFKKNHSNLGNEHANLVNY